VAVIPLSPHGPQGLSSRPSLPPEALERGSPAIQGHGYFSDPEHKVQCVVWGATPYRIHPKQRADFEFSLLLEGKFTLTDGEGNDTHLYAGDAFVLPPGFTYQWGQDVPVLKYALSFTPPVPPALGLLFTPFTASDLADPAPIVGQCLLFGEPSGRFRVTLEDIAVGDPARQLGRDHTVLSVISGAVTLAEAGADTRQLGQGQTAFISAGTACTLSAQAPARLLACTVSTI
jgi:uncharacterized cupin superfamily protein